MTIYHLFTLCLGLSGFLCAQEQPELPVQPALPEAPAPFFDDRPKLNVPTPEEAKKCSLAWVEACFPGDAQRKAKCEEIWKEQSPIPVLLEKTLAAFHDGAAAVLKACEAGDAEAAHKAASQVLVAEGDTFLKANLGEVYARFLTTQRMYDEALEVYSHIAVEDVIDPCGFLFFRGVCEFELLKKTEALDTLGRLQDNAGSSPERYAGLSRLMLFDMEYLDEEGLDHLSRTMGDVQRRFELSQLSQKAQDQEKEIIDRLDKLIKKLEDMQSGGGCGGCKQGGGPRSSSPAKVSAVMRGKGPGEIDKRAQKGASAWGNLPEKERARMLQALGRDFPAHYRSAIEEYFRKLASEEKDSKEP